MSRRKVMCCALTCTPCARPSPRASRSGCCTPFMASAIDCRWTRVKLRLSLRSRIAGTILALVAGAGISLATFAHLADERIEVSTRYDLLSEELTHYEH